MDRPQPLNVDDQFDALTDNAQFVPISFSQIVSENVLLAGGSLALRQAQVCRHGDASYLDAGEVGVPTFPAKTRGSASARAALDRHGLQLLRRHGRRLQVGDSILTSSSILLLPTLPRCLSLPVSNDLSRLLI